jgi:hypothetical protein
MLEATLSEQGDTAIWYTNSDLSTGKSIGASYQPSQADVNYFVVAQSYSCVSPYDTIKVKTFPTAPPTIQVDYESLCHNMVSTLRANGKNISWYSGVNQTFLSSGQNSITYKWSAPGAHIFFATQRSMTPDGLTSCTSAPDTKTIIDKAIPKAISVTPVTLCDNWTLVPFATDYSGTNDSIIWQNSSGVNLYIGKTYTPKKADLIPGQVMTYTATVRENGCYSDAALALYTVQKMVPAPAISQSPNPFCIGSSAPLQIIINSTLPYYWLDQNNNPTRPDSVLAKAQNPGSYIIKAYQTDVDGTCHSAIDSFVVHSYKTPNPTIVGKDSVCENSYSVAYNITVDDQDAANNYKWSVTGNVNNNAVNNNQSFNRTFDFISPGIDTISVVETSKEGCSNSAIKVVKTAPKPKPLFSTDTPGQEGEIYFFNNSDQEPITNGSYIEQIHDKYFWNFGRPSDKLIEIGDSLGTLDNPIKQNYDYGYWKVTLLATNNFGCQDSYEKDIFINISVGLYVPNTLVPESPSAQLRLFKPVGFNLKSYKISIYDTWGNLIWYSDKLVDGSPAEGWDGTANGQILKMDSYIYKIEAEFKNGQKWEGNKRNNGKSTNFGNVLLMR